MFWGFEGESQAHQSEPTTYAGLFMQKKCPVKDQCFWTCETWKWSRQELVSYKDASLQTHQAPRLEKFRENKMVAQQVREAMNLCKMLRQPMDTCCASGLTAHAFSSQKCRQHRFDSLMFMFWRFNLLEVLMPRCVNKAIRPNLWWSKWGDSNSSRLPSFSLVLACLDVNFPNFLIASACISQRRLLKIKWLASCKVESLV